MKTTSTPVMINFDLSPKDRRLVNQIARRAVNMAQEAKIAYDYKDAQMDLAAVHLSDCKLDLEKFLSAPDSDFGHDAFGIRKFIDRKTGKLTEAFVPRCSAKS